MSLDIKLSNDNLISYARTDDAVEAFGRSVENGQSRLALEVLVDVIDGLISKIEELESKITTEESPVEVKPKVKAKEDTTPKANKEEALAEV